MSEEIDPDRWKNRRRMAWICMIAALVYPALIFTSNSTQLGEIAVPFYLFVSAVVGAYIGFATVDDKWMMQNKRRSRPRDDFFIDPQDYRDNRL